MGPGDSQGDGLRERSASSVPALSSSSYQAGRALTGSWASDIPQGWCEQMTFEHLHPGTGDIQATGALLKDWHGVFTERILLETLERAVCAARRRAALW